MTLVYAKIMGMFVYLWGEPGGQRGYLEISKTGSNTYMAVCRGWEGGGNDLGEEGGGKGGGERL